MIVEAGGGPHRCPPPFSPRLLSSEMTEKNHKDSYILNLDGTPAHV